MTAQEARVGSMHNEMLVNLDERLDDITRLSYELPTDTPDEKLIAMVMCFVGGLLHLRRHQSQSLEVDS